MTGSRLIVTVVTSAAVLLVCEIGRFLLLRTLARQNDPQKALSIQFVSPFLINFVFMVMLPAVVYAALYPILPFTSYRSGLFIALFVFGVGLLPAHLRTANQYKLPGVPSTFDLFWNLLTLLLVIGSITYTYHY